jgi:hypothetical protein
VPCRCRRLCLCATQQRLDLPLQALAVRAVGEVEARGERLVAEDVADELRAVDPAAAALVTL